MDESYQLNGFEIFINKIRTLGEWLGYETTFALSELLNKCIEVHQVDCPEIIFGEMYGRDKALKILYTGIVVRNHYDSIMRDDDDYGQLRLRERNEASEIADISRRSPVLEPNEQDSIGYREDVLSTTLEVTEVAQDLAVKIVKNRPEQTEITWEGQFLIL